MQIIKRDGRIEPFDRSKIWAAIAKCFIAQGHKNIACGFIDGLTDSVVAKVSKINNLNVETVQDTVELVLNQNKLYDIARAYILYREERTKLRKRKAPQDIKDKFDISSAFFPTAIQQFQFFNKYSRYDWELSRRETWIETVNRTVSYLRELSNNILNNEIYNDIRDAITRMEVLPSMRLLAMAGPAARKNNITIYNCSFLPVSDILSFAEALYISMSGCGVGYSVERKFVDKLPTVIEQNGEIITHRIEDSAEGWFNALMCGLLAWFSGNDVVFDYSFLRPAGAVLRTKGGRASGPEPFRKTLNFVRSKILSKQGQKLTPLDAHDIMCAVGNAAVSGGMRRTAMLSLFDWDNTEMMHCKDGDFWRKNNQRWNANNSIVLPESLEQTQFIDFFMKMIKSQRGEPGIFNRNALDIPLRRQLGFDFGCNPCGEVALRPYQFCNLSAIVARENDTPESLREKARLATIIGTIQSMATNFPMLRKDWAINCQEERLLGVDITGQMDCYAVQNKGVLQELKEHCKNINTYYSWRLGVNKSASITCTKPSGNSSVLVDCSPGIHSRWAKYYIRNVRVNANSSVYQVLKHCKVPMSPENGQDKETANTWVIHFPVKAPNSSITRHDRGAIEQCEYWLMVKNYWAEHSVSCTITYKPDEIIDLMKWVYENKDHLSGLTFLPTTDALYDLMPYVEITREEYEKRQSEFPKIDFSLLWLYEQEDNTTVAQEKACGANGCEI
jgi:ribonucleoside-diphosphate reductase alpha chain